MTQSEDEPIPTTKTPEEVALAAVSVALSPAPTPVSTLITTTLAEMPSEHISHAAVYADEAQTKLSSTTSQISILTTQREGMVGQYEAAKLDMETKHAAELAKLDRRIEDLEEVIEMAKGCLSARRSPQ